MHKYRVSNVKMQNIHIYSNAMFLETVNPYAKNATVKTITAMLFFLIEENFHISLCT